MRLTTWIVALALTLAASAALAQQPKTIKDPAEYNAYISALKLTDLPQKAAAMENFVAKYPNSVVKQDALEQAMAAYQQANNQPGVEKTAQRILQIDPGNVRALAILTFIERTKATAGDKTALASMEAHAQQGLAALPGWKKTEGMSDADFAKLRGEMAAIFNGAAGFAALQAKDNAKARDFYLKAVAAVPDDFRDVYQLGIAELEMSPSDPDGFWHIARSINLAKAQNLANAVPQIDAYGRAKYKRYHGSEDGWDKIVAQAAQGTAVPAGFAQGIKPAPSPAEIAVIAVKDNDPKDMSIEDWEYILGYRDASPENKAAADKVWQTIQTLQKNGAAKVKVPLKVVTASASTIDGAITDASQKANIADARVTMAKPLTSIPAPGASVTVQAVFTDYKPKPFLFLMKDGELAP